MSEPEASAPTSAELAEWAERAHDRWPLIAFDLAAFARHLGRLGRPRPPFPVDAFLAAACAAGEVHALRALEQEFVARVPDVVRRFDGSHAFASDLCQQVRIRLLVGEDGRPPRIASYTGEVPLSAWIRVVAIRLALNAKRGARAVQGLNDEPGAPGVTDPEVELLRQQYREAFRGSFREAIAALSKDDRTILRLHYVDGVNIDGIGRVFQVHRATVARWLVRIRGDLLNRAKAILAQQVGAELEEAESVMGALAFEVDLTLSRALGGEARAPGDEPQR